jgi:UDP-N-acetylmuramate--alanine ligase
MHIYFSGIGGVGIGPLALIAKQAGYEVSGSDLREGDLTEYLTSQGITDIHIRQDKKQIAQVHADKPIDWFVYSSALPANHAELAFCKQNGIKTSKRDELLNKIITDKKLKLIAVAGTHGKTTTTAMVIWLFKQLGIPISYSLGAHISFGDIGHFDKDSQYFIYEGDEFDRNFLAFHPFYSVISGLGHDHHEIYPTKEDYYQAFKKFLSQSQRAILWREDIDKLGLGLTDEKYTIAEYDDEGVGQIKLAGLYNRRDGWLAVKAVSQIAGPRSEELIEVMNRFPGVSRRFEQIVKNLYSDDAHTPEKIKGCMSVAKEKAVATGQKIIVLYEPLTNRRMHHLGSAHRDVFEGAEAIYWLPSYLAREDPNLVILEPNELIRHLSPKLAAIARPADKDNKLKQIIQEHLNAGNLVVAMAGGGAGSLDEWLRKEFKT